MGISNTANGALAQFTHEVFHVGLTHKVLDKDSLSLHQIARIII